MRLRDERLEVLARAAGWSAAGLAARLQIDLRTLQALRPDRDMLPSGGMEVVCSLFGLSEDEYSFFSPYLPAKESPRHACVRARDEGLARVRAAIAKREKDRDWDCQTTVMRIRNECSASWKRLRKGPSKSPLERNRYAHMTRLLAKVDAELRRAMLPEWTARRFRRNFERLATR